MILHLGGNLPFYAPGRANKFDIPLMEPTRLVEIAERLGVPVSEVYLTVINGELAALDEALITNTDEVRLYPAIDGG